MAYTVGIKKFGFWTTNLRVKRHSWENFRFIFDLEDGSQLLVPGFRCSGVKVYPDFWDHVKLEKQKAEAAKLAAALKREEESRASLQLQAQERAELEKYRAMMAESQLMAKRSMIDPPSQLGAALSMRSDPLPEPSENVNTAVYQRALERVNDILPS